MSLAVYAPSLALWAATGAPVPLWVIIVILGSFATAYTFLGGMKAVIWTDVIQFVVLFGGMVLACILIIFQIDGGVAGIWATMREAGKTSIIGHVPEMANVHGFWQSVRAYFCTTEATLIGAIIASFVGHVAFYCVDQVTVQRYFTAKNLKEAKKSFWLNSFANVSLHFGLAFLGMALFAYFAVHAPPETIAGKPFKFDWRYPFFIATAMPVGVAGLLIAALYAATMSSVDSGINSCCTAFLVDFWQRLKYGQVRPTEGTADDAQQHDNLVVARIATLVFGVIVIVVGCLIPRIGESIISMTNTLVNAICGPMFAIFLLGMFCKRARPVGVCIGAVASLYVTYSLRFDAQVMANVGRCIVSVGLVSAIVGLQRKGVSENAWAACVGVVGAFLLRYAIGLGSVGGLTVHVLMFIVLCAGLFTRQYRTLAGWLLIGALIALLPDIRYDFITVLMYPDKLSFQWPAAVALAVGLVVGYLASLLEGPCEESKLEWTFARQKQLWTERAAESSESAC
jgi:SSS family transporter